MTVALLPILFLFAGILLFEMPGLISRKYWRELAAFLIVWGISLVLALLLVFDIPVPNPQDSINNSIKYIFSLIPR